MADVSRYRRVCTARVVTAVSGGLLVFAFAARTPAAWPGLPAMPGQPQAAGAQSPRASAPARPPATVASAAGQAPRADGVAGHQAMVTQYCVTCHNDRTKAGSLVLDPRELVNVGAHAELWEQVIRKLNAGLMPPQGMPRPADRALDGLRTWLAGELDQAAAASPNPGRPMLHRLNRTEYANAIRDLFHVDVDAASLLPPDDSAFGFDNVSDVLGVSPSLQERYLTAATRIAALAVGDVNIRPGSMTYRVAQDLSQNQHVEGMPLGTIGGTRMRHFFPVDGEYDIQTKLYRTNLNIVRGLEYPSEFEVSIDGRPVHRVTIGGAGDLAAMFDKPTDTGDAVDARMRVKVPVTAGTHDVSVSFVGNLPVMDAQRLQLFLRSSADNFDWSGRPHIQTVQIAGPFAVTGPGNSASRREIFTCSPKAGRADEAADAACAKQILSRIAQRAYRRPVGDAELKPIMQFYEEGRGRGFEAGIQRGIERILASPLFIFRIEQDPPGSLPGRPYRLSDFELASRLAFFLWSSIPDDELLRVASKGRLRDDAVLMQQVTRMLADTRAEALVSNFAGQWLQLRNVRSVQPNSDMFPDFDDNLRRGFRRETELLFASIVRENRSVLDLLTADYTFVNERLARHYGIPGVYGSHYRRVAVRDEARRGLLGHGSILAVTSHAERTSPVLRGKWVLENLLGQPVPPPPEDVPQLPAPSQNAPKTLRQQMELHRATPVCASCHKVMDPIGFAFENFDAVGAWRTREAGGTIDTSGQLADGTKIDGIRDLRTSILAKPELFVSTMTEKMLIYSLGRGVEATDRPVLRQIVRESQRDGYTFSSLVFGIVRSAPFQFRLPASDASPVKQTATREAGTDRLRRTRTQNLEPRTWN
jgi:mono/diheme cytochrome c family protein